jgi:alpha-tubulin suppressor-like RCC1 family protein
VAADSAGAVWTWGIASDLLGKGADTKPSTVPWPITGVGNIVSVAAGETHTLALRADGMVWAWGDDSYGQSGRGVGSDSTSFPTQAVVVTQAMAVAAGEFHSVALQKSGVVWTWGEGSYGQLGNGGTDYLDVPTVVTNIDNVIAIAAGYAHTIALTVDKTVWTWGNNGSRFL